MQTDRPMILSWGLLIATKDRPDELEICIRLALEQTRPPAEVIVVDASAAWADHAQRIAALVEKRSEVRFSYFPAELPSLTVQRNQAILEAKADIVFMIDDDSFMYPDCAERIMEVYEADRENSVVGVQATLSPDMPIGEGIVAERKIIGPSSNAALRTRWRWVYRKVFLMGATEIFIPYDGDYHRKELPEHLKEFGLATMPLFHGARMTYRRSVIARTCFDPILRYYCPMEDHDASYRASREGALVTAQQARLHHYTTAGGRIDRFALNHLTMLNHAVLLRRNAARHVRAERRYFILMARRVLAEALKDLLARRFSLPQFRGAWAAMTSARRVFAMSDAELEVWYPGAQERIVKG